MKKMMNGLTTADRIVVEILVNVVLVAMAVALLTACSNEPEDVLTVKTVAPRDTMASTAITFTFCNISMEAMTRATLAESQMTDLWLFDYMDGELKATIHQTSEDDGFGAITLTADYGEHRLYFVASRGDTPTIDGTTISWAKPSDTFWQSLTLDIEPQTSTNQSVVLHRVVTRLRIAVTDEVPANMKTLTITPSTWYYGLDYTTGEPINSQANPRVITVPSSYIGTMNLATSFYCLCPADGFDTDITVTAKDADDTAIANIALQDVPFERNRITNYSGSLFTQNRAVSVTTDDEWLDEYTTTW